MQLCRFGDDASLLKPWAATAARGLASLAGRNHRLRDLFVHLRAGRDPFDDPELLLFVTVADAVEDHPQDSGVAAPGFLIDRVLDPEPEIGHERNRFEELPFHRALAAEIWSEGV